MEKYYRPILKLKKTRVEKVWDAIGAAVFLGALLYLVLSWSGIPDQVPGHFNGAGEVDRWGSKMELFILPIIGFFLWGLMVVFEKLPHAHNYPERLNEENVEAFYLNSRKILNSIKNICLLTFAFLEIQTIRVALGQTESLGIWFLPVMLVAMFIPIIKGMITSSRIK